MLVKQSMSLVAFIVVVFCFCSPSDAGWLSDKLEEAARKIGEKAVNDTSEGAYSKTKQGVKKAVDTKGGSTQAKSVPPDSDREEHEDGVVAEEAEGYSEEEGVSGDEEFEEPRGLSRRKASVLRPQTNLHFSADYVTVDPDLGPEGMEGKLYVDGERMRLEMPDPEGTKHALIMNVRTGSTILLLSGDGTYMELPSEGAEEDWENFSVVLADHRKQPCEGYRNSKNLGKSTHEGRTAIRWECRGPEDPDEPAVQTIWVDAKWGIPLRVDSGEGERSELRNLREGRPAASLFEVPRGQGRSGGRKAVNPYAPKVVPVKGSEGSMWAAVVGAAVVPEGSAVGIPAFPGARLLQTLDEPLVPGAKNRTVVLVTEDPPEKVLAFYRKQLPGWKEASLFNSADAPVLYEGSGDANPFSNPFSVEAQSTRHVVVEGLTEATRIEVAPKARTKITVGYRPQS